jgi:hypothetical protein
MVTVYIYNAECVDSSMDTVRATELTPLKNITHQILGYINRNIKLIKGYTCSRN